MDSTAGASSSVTASSSSGSAPKPVKPKASPANNGIPPNPKGFFANERTFLHWLQLCVWLGAVAVTLVNFGNWAGQAAGVLFGVISVFCMFYSLIQYYIRGDRLQQKEKGSSFEDMTSALVMVTVVALAIAANFILHFLYPQSDNRGISSYIFYNRS